MAETLRNVYEILSMPYSLLVLAFVLDLCMGDPEWLPHPVRAMGWAIQKLESFLRYVLQISGQKSHIAEKITGSLLALIIGCSAFGLFYLIPFPIHYPLFTSFVLLLIMVYLISTTLAVKGLIDSADDVIAALADKNITDARIKVGYIVGRDTDSLNEKGIIRATIESLAENASDGIVAPVFYFAIGGLPLAMTYKAINAMDSLLGYKNERYRYFGWAAARLDDIANYIPARITGILIVVSSGVVFRSLFTLHCSLKTMFRDGGKHSSPNSGVPEAAIAGALGVRLGGPSTYGGVSVEKPYIGEDLTEDYLYASDRAIKIVRLTSLFGVISATVLLYVRYAI
ncbi:MAG: cobalamin biosynthesis protein CobD [Nitrospirae bacterium]|nr:cobalamin biosynthesis protein CobD [Nitrospirota bacterium]